MIRLKYVGTRGRPDPRLRDRRLRHRGRGDQDEARELTGHGRHAGRVLTVAWAPGQPIRMRGSATHVFEGELDLDALA